MPIYTAKKNHKFFFSNALAVCVLRIAENVAEKFFHSSRIANTTSKNRVYMCVEIGRYLETGGKHGHDLGCGVFPARWPTRSRNTVCRSSDFRWSWWARDQNIENVSLQLRVWYRRLRKRDCVGEIRSHRSNAHRETSVESSHETGLPLRKLDLKLFWLSFMQSGFNQVVEYSMG